LNDGPGGAEPNAVVAAPRGDREAVGGGKGIAVERAATQRTITIVSDIIVYLLDRFVPLYFRKIGIHVLAPLRDIAVHVEEPKAIGPQRAARKSRVIGVEATADILRQQSHVLASP